MALVDPALHDRFKDSFNFGCLPEFDKTILNSTKSSLIRQGRSARVLTVGPGPVNLTGEFVEELIPFCSEITLVEPSRSYCEAYEKQHWFVENESKLCINCDTLENVMQTNQLSQDSFDLIWCFNVIYMWRMEDMPAIIKYINDLLQPSTGTAVFLYTSSQSWMNKMKKQLCPTYQHVEIFNRLIDHSACKSVRFSGISRKVTPNARDLFRIIYDSNVLRQPDYRQDPNAPLTDAEIQQLEEVVEMSIKFTMNWDDAYVFALQFDCCMVVK